MPGFLGGSSGAASSGAGGEITFPKEFIDPVTKLRVSQPENLIDTDFEYGLQPTKWETVELINNTPSFFSKSGDTTIPGIVDITTNAGTREITVTTALDHGLAVGIPINVQGTKSVTADGSYIINSIPDTKTFTYLSRDIQDDTSAIEDLYTSIITGEFFQGSQLRVAESDGIVTDAESISTLTVTTENPHGFGPNTPFYFLNLNSTISQEFEAANTAAKSFDASNSATAQTFDGSNSLSSLNIDWSNSATVAGTISTIDGVNTTNNTITVAHSTENFSGLPLGQPLYYSVNASLGYFLNNPRGVVFLKSTDNLGEGVSTFQVSEIPDGDAINLQSNMTGSFQIANQARTFAGNNVNSQTETVINVVRENAIEFEGANDQALGGNGDATVTGFNSPFINLSTSAGAGLDYYVGAMVRYDTTGSAASGLTDGETYFISSFQDTGSDTYTIALKEFPNDANLISVSGGTGTQTFTRIGVSLTKDIVHIKNSQYSEKDMLEYEFPSAGNFEADEEKVFYFISTVYDAHNYKLNPVSESFIAATGGNVTQTVEYDGRNYTVHRFTSDGTFTLNVTDAGTFGQDLKFTIEGSGSSFGGATTQGTRAAAVESISVVVDNGGRVDVAYPQDGLTNDIPFSVINPVPLQATGGTTSDVTIDGREYRVHTFTSTGVSSFTVNSLGNISGSTLDILIVGGGGGAGDTGRPQHVGAGGAGGLVYVTGHTPTTRSYSITVGAGGTEGTNGGNSVFETVGTALGGGRGGDDGNSNPAGNGGSGGGAGRTSNNSVLVSGGQGLQPNQTITTDGTVVHNAGNDGGGSSGYYGSGGGGGAATAGSTAVNSTGGAAGDGLQVNITGNNYYWAGGGGGGTSQNQDGYNFSTFGDDGAPGGLGGGGGGGTDARDPSGKNPGADDDNGINPAFRPSTNIANPGVGGPNTGGGSGGSGKNSTPGSADFRGGSGIVVVRYPLEAEEV